MATIARLNVLLDLDDHSFRSKMQKSRDTLNSWGKGLRDAGGKMTAGITAPLALAGGAMVRWSSDLEQTLGATEQLWGSNADSIIAWAETTDRALGMTQNETLTSMNRYNALLKDLEDGTGNVADMSQLLTERSADLSAMWGGSSIEASDALTSALRGNYEGLDKYNINLTEAMVSQEAMNIAVADGRDEITEADKTQARYNLIMEQSASSQGQFARETNTTAGKLAVMSARARNLATNFGRLLLPYVNKGVDLLSKLVGWLEQTDETTRKWIIGIAAAAAVMGPFLIALGVMLPALGAIAAAIGFLVSPIGLVVIAIAALVAGLIYAYTEFEWFREIVDSAASAIKAFVTGAIDVAIAAFNRLRDAFDAGGWSAVFNELLVMLGELAARLLVIGANMIQGLWDGAVGKWNEFTGWLAGRRDAAIAWIVGMATALLVTGSEFIQGLWDGAVNKWNEFTTWLTGLPAEAVTWIGDTTLTLAQKGTDLLAGLYIAATTKWHEMTDWLTALPGAAAAYIGDVATTLTQKGIDLITGLWTGALTTWATMAAWVTSIPSLVVTAIGSTAWTLWSKGVDLLDGLRDGAVAGWNSLYNWLTGVPGMIASAIGDLSGSLYSAGVSIMNGLLSGLQDGWGTVTGWLSGLNPADWKGPEQRDKKMLYMPGVWIMEGLSRGLAEGWHDVTRQLAGFTPELSYAITGGRSSQVMSAYGSYGPPPSHWAAARQPTVVNNDNRTFLALKSEEWVKYAEMAENAPERTIHMLNEAERTGPM